VELAEVRAFIVSTFPMLNGLDRRITLLVAIFQDISFTLLSHIVHDSKRTIYFHEWPVYFHEQHVYFHERRVFHKRRAKKQKGYGYSCNRNHLQLG